MFVRVYDEFIRGENYVDLAINLGLNLPPKHRDSEPCYRIPGSEDFDLKTTAFLFEPIHEHRQNKVSMGFLSEDKSRATSSTPPTPN